jgi:hypothetical protein
MKGSALDMGHFDCYGGIIAVLREETRWRGRSGWNTKGPSIM